MSALSMQLTRLKYKNNAHFDTDSGTLIGVDNMCSLFISNIMDEFIGPLEECNCGIKRLGGTRTLGVKIGRIKC